jgi:hypothetical protein
MRAGGLFGGINGGITATTRLESSIEQSFIFQTSGAKKANFMLHASPLPF